MIRTWMIRILLSPFALLYGLAIAVRNILYDQSILKSSVFSVPTIGVGNLSVGGTGKTPHVEYLITMLRQYVQVSVLSRGYKRRSSGFLMVHQGMSSDDCGDEPLQYKRKYPEVHVAVSESRMLGIPALMGVAPETQVILLDDIFQHRSVLPYINILLTEYRRPFTRDFLLPVGRLREWPSGAKRADVIIVTKCPWDLSVEQKDKMVETLKPYIGQWVFFSTYQYGFPYYMYNGAQRLQLAKPHNVVLLTAIAHSDFLTEYVSSKVNFVRNISFEDHRDFSKYDLAQIKRVFDHLDMPYKYILTTEKDAIRLDKHRSFLIENKIPVFVLPIKVVFLFDGQYEFDRYIKNRLLEFKS